MSRSFLFFLLTPLLFGAPIWIWFTCQNQLFTTRAMIQYGRDDWHTLLLLCILNVPVYAMLVYIALTGTMMCVKTPILPWADLGLVAPAWNRRTVFLVVASIPALLLAELVAGVVSVWMQRIGFIGTTTRTTLVTNFAALPLSRGFMVLLLCIVAPLCEEIFFRGFVLHRLTRILPSWLAVLLSSIVFASLHFDPMNWWSYFLPGIVFGIVVQISRSLWPGIVLHTMLNTSFVLMTLAAS